MRNVTCSMLLASVVRMLTRKKQPTIASFAEKDPVSLALMIPGASFGVSYQVVCLVTLLE